MGKLSCEIERVDNGFVLKNTSDNSEDAFFNLEVFQDSDRDDEFSSSVDALSGVFWRIAEHFGIYNSKHNEWRLIIDIVKNENYE